LTAVSKALFAFAFGWPLILIGRTVAWFGRGIRGPLRDAMLADSVDARNRGKAFGFHRAGDTAGAVAGPLAAFGMLAYFTAHPSLIDRFHSWLPIFPAHPSGAFRIIFLATLIPGLLSVVSMAFLVKEKRRAKNHELKFLGVIRSLPKDYLSFLLAAGVFGLGDFAPTLMILRATTLLEPTMGLAKAAQIGALLYLLRNIVYAAASYPIGHFSDRFSRTGYLAVGYGIAVLAFIGFMFATPAIWWLAGCFFLAGIFIAWEDTIEGVAVRDYVRTEVAGTAYGVLGVVNGIGDFVSSFVVGLLWTSIGPRAGFTFAVVVAGIGAVWMAAIGHWKKSAGAT
jgi:MFS family permease